MKTLVRTVSLVLKNLSYGNVSSYTFLKKIDNSRSLNNTVKMLRNFWILPDVSLSFSGYRLFPCVNTPERPEGSSGLTSSYDIHYYNYCSGIRPGDLSDMSSKRKRTYKQGVKWLC